MSKIAHIIRDFPTKRSSSLPLLIRVVRRLSFMLMTFFSCPTSQYLFISGTIILNHNLFIDQIQ
jgi:hypothetical protein